MPLNTSRHRENWNHWKVNLPKMKSLGYMSVSYHKIRVVIIGAKAVMLVAVVWGAAG